MTLALKGIHAEHAAELRRGGVPIVWRKTLLAFVATLLASLFGILLLIILLS